MKSISRRQFLRVSAVAGAGAVLAACGGAKEETPATEEATVEPTPKPIAATATPKPQPTPEPVVEKTWPRENVERKRTLNLMNGVSTNVGFGNPYSISHQQGAASQYEAMFYYTALNDKVYAWIAESYEYNADATELTVYLRKGVMWNDGEPFTAADVAFTYTWVAENPTLGNSQFIRDMITKVEALDDYTVKFTFKEPNLRGHFNYCTYWFDRGVYLVPKHIWEGQKPPAADQEVPIEWKHWDPEGHPEWPVCTGPYKITRTEQNFNQFDLRYEWWAVDVGLADRMPWPERITDIAYPNDEVGGQLLLNNEVDATLDMRPGLISSLLDQAPDHIISHTGLNKPYGYTDWWPISMFFNTLEKPYDDPKVRWAICYAIDQQTVVDVGYDGAGKATFFFYPDYPGVTQYYEGAKDLMAQYNVLEANQEKVDSLMTEAGFVKNADGLFEYADGTPFKLDLFAPVPLFADIGPVTAELMRQAGFDCTHVTPPDDWTQMSTGTALLHFFGTGGSVIDPYYSLMMRESRWVQQNGTDPGYNRSRWGNTEYDAIVQEMSRTSPDDKVKMQELFNKAIEIWLKELPEVPLVQWFHRLAMNTTYWTGWPNQDNAYNSAFWHLTFPITLWNLEPTQ
jgi:peptide/nickel transport system substrate-binding protein